MRFRTSFVLALVVALLSCAGSAQAGHRSKLLINTDRPIAVLVDGQMLEFVEGTTRVELHNVDPGLHMIEFRNMFGKLVGEGRVTFPGGGDAIVRAQWKDKTFSVYDTVMLEPEVASVVVQVPAYHEKTTLHVGMGGVSASVHASESTTTTTTTTTSVSPGMGVHVVAGHGMGGMHMGAHGVHSEVTVTETTHTTTGPGVVVVEERVPATRTVTFRSTDEEWANVYIDGARVWEIRAMDTEKSITLSTGEHTLEVKDFMENETWCKGRLLVDGHTDLIIGITEGRPVEVYNDSNAFRR
jgi:hypothetical protein